MHVPYQTDQLPFPMQLQKCATCHDAMVPDVLLCTTEPPVDLTLKPPDRLQMKMPRMVQARIVRRKSDLDGEALAKAISDVGVFGFFG